MDKGTFQVEVTRPYATATVRRSANHVGGVLTLSIRQARRMQRLSLVTEQIAHGALEMRLPTEREDDVAMVSKLVNSMLTRIERLMGEVKSTCVPYRARSQIATIACTTCTGTGLGRQ
jgi:HAMP domain-containing protein